MSMDLVPLRDLVLEVTPGFASGAHNSEGTGIPHLRPMNVDSRGKIALETVKSVQPDVNSRRLTTGDVLFNNTNSPDLVGKTALFALPGEYAFSNHMTRIRVNYDLLDPAFLSSFLHSKWMDGTFKRLCSNHVNQASISRAVLQGLDVPVPPLDKQRRIVAELEDQLGRLDATRTQLTQAETQFEQIRASALNQYSGFSASHRDENFVVPLTDLLSMQIGGVWGEVADQSEKNVRVIRITELHLSDKMDTDGGVERSITEKQFSSRKLRRGDLLLEKSGGGPNQPVGRVGLVDEDPDNVVCSNFMLLMRPNQDRALPRFLHLYLNHRHRSGHTIPLQTSSTNIRNINTKDYLNQDVPCPPLEDQKRIVAEFEEIQASLDVIGSRLSDVDGLVESARASVLHRAFSWG